MNQDSHELHAEQEASDIDVRAIFKLLLAMVIGLVVVGFVVYWQFRGFEQYAKDSAPPPSPFAKDNVTPPGPLLEVNEAGNALEYRQEQEQAIETWGWANADHTRAKIPIERAMAIVAEKGLPSFPAPEPLPTEAPAAGAEGATP